MKDLEELQSELDKREYELDVKIKENEGLREELHQYHGEFGIHNHFKEMFLKMIEQHQVTDTLVDVLKDEILDGLPDLDDLETRVSDMEYENENKPAEYELTDIVVDSEELENKVEELVKESLRNVTLRLEDV